uniref:Glycosyltransferase n=1 Tax=Arundo donax TaxID=35708 RepID=A0A0A9FW53_ARUDO
MTCLHYDLAKKTSANKNNSPISYVPWGKIQITTLQS